MSQSRHAPNEPKPPPPSSQTSQSHHHLALKQTKTATSWPSNEPKPPPPGPQTNQSHHLLALQTSQNRHLLTLQTSQIWRLSTPSEPARCPSVPGPPALDGPCRPLAPSGRPPPLPPSAARIHGVASADSDVTVTSLGRWVCVHSPGRTRRRSTCSERAQCVMTGDGRIGSCTETVFKGTHATCC